MILISILRNTYPLSAVLFFYIRQLCQIRPSLARNSAIVLVNALVQSKLDYCNSLLNDLPTTSIARLQYKYKTLWLALCATLRNLARTQPLFQKLCIGFLSQNA